MNTRHPMTLPDEVVLKLSAIAAEHGYGIERLTLTWRTKGIGVPEVGRVDYALQNKGPARGGGDSTRTDDP